jgi:hypothetical protein
MTGTAADDNADRNLSGSEEKPGFTKGARAERDSTKARRESRAEFSTVESGHPRRAADSFD